jgi:uncharacterized membrane protein
MLICGLTEYITSLALEYLFRKKWWDYSYLALNLNGRICLFSMLMFGIAGCLLIFYIAPFLNRQIGKIPPCIQKIICITFGSFFCMDMFLSLIDPNVGWGITF